MRSFSKSILSVIIIFYEISQKAFFKSDVNLNPKVRPIKLIFFLIIQNFYSTLFKKLMDSTRYDKPIRKGCNIRTDFLNFFVQKLPPQYCYVHH